MGYPSSWDYPSQRRAKDTMLRSGLMKNTNSDFFNILLRLFDLIDQGRVSRLKSSLVLLKQFWMENLNFDVVSYSSVSNKQAVVFWGFFKDPWKAALKRSSQFMFTNIHTSLTSHLPYNIHAIKRLQIFQIFDHPPT